MKKERDYIQDIAEIRSMMERSAKFLSLSGWAGIMAGIYALAGAFVAWKLLDFNPGEMAYISGSSMPQVKNLVLLAGLVLVLAIGTAVFDSYRKARSRNEKAWNATSRRLLTNMAVPLVTGGIVILLLIGKGMVVLVLPLTLIFYGLALFIAAKFTYTEIRILGLVEIVLGLIATWFTGYGLVLWAAGFGAAHIIYGLYMHYRYGQ